jgi:CheY-like chemotaxis protein
MVMKRKVLVADASKVVRASLAKQLAEHFDVREEASGESAWQTLVLDSAIAGVVSGVNLNRLDGLGLLERVRDSKLARIRSLPFFLVVSSSFGESDRHLARSAARLILFQRIPAMPRWRMHCPFCGQRPGMHPNLQRWPLSLSYRADANDSASEEVGTRTDVGERYSGANGWRAGFGNPVGDAAMTVWETRIRLVSRKNWMSAWPIF